MKWHIGQEIVCIKTHSNKVIKRGQVFTIKGLQQSPCNCNEIDIDVGIKGNGSGIVLCPDCGVSAHTSNNINWFSEELFAPLEYNKSAIEELLEQPIHYS